MKEPLRAQIRRHITEHPNLTAYAIARAINRGQGATFQALCRLEQDGLAEHTESPRTPTDRRPALRWRATDHRRETTTPLSDGDLLGECTCGAAYTVPSSGNEYEALELEQERHLASVTP